MAHRAGLDHAAVVETAARLVDEEGLEQLSLGRLAEKLGIRSPSLYNHVAGLPGLRHDLALYCARELLNALIRATVGKSGAEAVRALADTVRAYAREHPGRYTLTVQSPPADDPERVAVGEDLVSVIAAVLQLYNLSDENMIHAIRSVRSIVQGFVTLEAAGGFAMPVSLDRSFHWLIDLFITGLETASRADSPSAPNT